MVRRAGRSSDDARQLARRLAALAQPNRALLCEKVYERGVDRFDFRGVGPVVAKSMPLPGPAFEVLGRKPERSGTHHTGPERIPLAGRSDILAGLDAARQDAAAGASVIVHLVGEPGLGKSKIVREWLVARQRDTTLAGWLALQVHGVPYGGYPLRGWRRLVAPLGGRAAEVPPVENVARAMIEPRRPTLLVVDDLHWIDAPSRDRLEALLETLARVPLFVILMYRPSFRSHAPDASELVQRRLRLSGLDDESTRAMVDALAAKSGDTIGRPVREEILAKSRGNPLYVEEALAYFFETRVNAPSADICLPSSLPALLMLRTRWTIERTLPALERDIHDERLLGGMGLGAMRGQELLVHRLEGLEEQLAAWLDRFDVVKEAAAPVVREFVERLARIDGALAVSTLLLGRQRPHRNRLAQAVRRLIAGLTERSDRR